ncbi:auxin-responsive protein SAUR72-like [Rhodamnia argentea]|uniref:Auxin-responsive protein SAUR72-like n=1 Tax=Rhodamnia argentea TaxID=178133 RepID=A0A8B8NYP3_9MYRT|nr:auxin-responsive protein SAUR72-like [Rhodamnia argentea]XP_048137628.1 auxin-responsive protein SAUR72-like [Rhodamnia argentea]
MDEKRRKQKRGLIFKTWERCKTLGRAGKGSSKPRPTHGPSLAKKSKSWNGSRPSSFREDDTPPVPRRHSSVKPHGPIPGGCFSVYVGPEKQRFAVRTECANHPLFQMLLEEAESEFGYNSGGPIELPCNVDLFYRVLTEMDCEGDGDGDGGGRRLGCGYGVAAYHLLSPARMIAVGHHY